jgi:hypothetical protein
MNMMKFSTKLIIFTLVLLSLLIALTACGTSLSSCGGGGGGY